jgi:hypothetical protein
VRGTGLASVYQLVAPSRVLAVFFAAFACTTLPARVAAQRVADYQPVRGATASTPLPRLQLAGAVPVRLPWCARDHALAVAFTTALLIDAAQTRRLARGGWRDYEESNPILGRNPSEGRVNAYTAVAGLAVLGVAAVAPKRVRPWVLGAALAVEVYALAAMSQRGVAIRF